MALRWVRCVSNIRISASGRGWPCELWVGAQIGVTNLQQRPVIGEFACPARQSPGAAMGIRGFPVGVITV